MFLVVAKKSRMFFGFLCSANEQVYKSWEGAQPGSWPNRSIPYQRRHAQCITGGCPEGRNLFQEFEIFPGVQTFSVSLARSGSSVVAAWRLAVQLVVRW